MKKTTLVAIILGVLVILSAVQVVQLNGLKTKVKEGGVSVQTAGSTTPVASSGDTGKTTSALPSSIKDLPQMVGGC